MTEHAEPHSAVSLYTGQTLHERFAPFRHGFRYRLLSILIDLDRLDEAGTASRLFSVERFNLFSFFRRDHGPRDGSSLRDWARARLAETGVEAESLRIRLLCFPRVLGYVFNPLSVYFAEDRGTGELKGVIYQVHNTFGDAHAYAGPAEETAGPVMQSTDKVFHVSPFFDLAGRYDFTLRSPGERFSLVIRKMRESGPDLLATMAMKRRAFTSATLARAFAALPFSTLQAIFGIHFQALRLVLKGARYHSRPEPGDTATQLEPNASQERFSTAAE